MNGERSWPTREKTRYPGVYRRGDKYVVRYRDGQNRERQQGGFRTAKLADTWKRERERDIADGVWLGEGQLPFEQYARETIKTYQGRGRRGFRESTREDYSRALELYGIPYFSGKLGRTVAQIGPRDVNAFVGWLCDEEAQGKTLSDSRVRNVVAPVRTLLAVAVEDGLIRFNPAANVRLPNREHLAPQSDDEEIEDETRALTPAQLRAFLAAVERHDAKRRGGQRHRLLFELLAATGLRWSEATALTWRHLELTGERPRVRVRWQIYRGRRVRPKSKYGKRDIPVPIELASKLRRHRLATGRTGDDDLVFATTAGTRLDHSCFMRDVVKPAGRDAGLTWVTPHTFRHTCASMLFAEGRNAVQVQRWLGHHSPAFTLSRYVHLLSDELGAPLDVPYDQGQQLRLHTSDG